MPTYARAVTWSLKRQALLPNNATTRFSILVLKRMWHAFRVHGQSARTAANACTRVGNHGTLAERIVGKMQPLFVQTKFHSVSAHHTSNIGRFTYVQQSTLWYVVAVRQTYGRSKENGHHRHTAHVVQQHSLLTDIPATTRHLVI